MDLPKYRIPRDLKSALEETEYPTLVGSVINCFRVKNKFLSVLQILKNVDHPIEIEDCHYRQLLKLGLYLEEYEQRTICGPCIKRVPHSKSTFKIYSEQFYFVSTHYRKKWILKNSVRLVANPNTCYDVKVLKVYRDHVVVSAPEKFCQDYNPDESYNVELIVDNYFFQCCHDALAAIAPTIILHNVFPKKEDTYTQKLNFRPTWFNTNISDDPGQAEAVLNIINKTAFPAPYILYGPPGTGKTTTLVEAIYQIWKQQSPGYILVCAPTNVACDVLTKKLLNCIPNTNDLYRVYSALYGSYKIDEDIKNISNYIGNDCFVAISRANVFNKKIIIATLCTASRLQKLSLDFSYVIIDETGQVQQPEATIPLGQSIEVFSV